MSLHRRDAQIRALRSAVEQAIERCAALIKEIATLPQGERRTELITATREETRRTTEQVRTAQLARPPVNLLEQAEYASFLNLIAEVDRMLDELNTPAPPNA